MAAMELAGKPLLEKLGKAWDSVDNRMGQVVYDNLFWRKSIKDIGMASVRSLGWNLGTFRELGGGALDFAKAGREAGPAARSPSSPTAWPTRWRCRRWRG
jgi:hypothetical protein